MKLNISAWHFEELIKKGYSLELYFLLKMMHEQNDISALCKGSAKIKVLYQTLIRKGLISDGNNDVITLLGIEIIQFMNSRAPRKIVKKKVDNTEFKKWWKSYPGTNTFTHKGVRFEGERALRIKESDCRDKFDVILSEGEHTSDELIKALEYEVLQKKEKSVETKENKLKYMQNSLTYLNQRTFEPFIELIKEGYKVVEKAQTGGTDI